MEQIQVTSLPQIAATALNDVRHYLSEIEPNAYQASLELLSGSTIGQHTRHIIEFYNCLLEQNLDTDVPVVNYAKRKRDHQIESQPDYALACINTICDRLKYIQTERTCLLDCTEHLQEGQAWSETEKDHVPYLIASTIGRELIYNIEHTIHHLAIVKIALKATVPSISLPAHFGVAPSTIHFRQESCAQ